MKVDLKKSTLTIRHIAIFALLGALIFAGDILMEAFPNVHFVGVLIVAATAVYRARALYPIYIYVLLSGLYAGFSVWWVPYLYVWTVLWGLSMLIPRRMPPWLTSIVCMLVCALHGLAFGTLYAPVHALMFGFSFEQTVAWISAGFYFDIVHAIGNLCLGTLILPIMMLLLKLEKRRI